MIDDTDKPPRIAFNVTSARVQHYSDVVEYLTRAAVAQCHADGWSPTPAEVDFFKKEVIRHAVIRRDLDTANKLQIKKQEVL